MQQLPNTDLFHAIPMWLDQSKFWIMFVGFIISGYKGFRWVQEIRTKDFVEVKTELSSIGAKMDAQTTALVRELSELRSDFRTFYISPAPTMQPVRARSPRKKKVLDKPSE